MNGQCLSICTLRRFPSVSISALNLILSFSPHFRAKSVSECFLPLSWPQGIQTQPPPPPHHLIIIHLGGRISTAWDIRPITQSRQATSPAHRLSLCSQTVLQFTGKDAVLDTSCKDALGSVGLSLGLTSLNNFGKIVLCLASFYDIQYREHTVFVSHT